MYKNNKIKKDEFRIPHFSILVNFDNTEKQGSAESCSVSQDVKLDLQDCLF